MGEVNWLVYSNLIQGHVRNRIPIPRIGITKCLLVDIGHYMGRPYKFGFLSIYPDFWETLLGRFSTKDILCSISGTYYLDWVGVSVWAVDKDQSSKSFPEFFNVLNPRRSLPFLLPLDMRFNKSLLGLTTIKLPGMAPQLEGRGSKLKDSAYVFILLFITLIKIIDWGR